MNTTFADLNAPLLRGYQSDIGKRPNQEDRWEIRDFQTADGRSATLAMIADGIGGHNTGEIASQMAKERIPARLTTSPPSASEITRRLKAALEEAGQAIYNASLEDPNRSGMGTTCTAIAVADRRLYLAHVGDSRTYLLRGGQLRQLTVDHTWAEEAIRAGRTPEEIRTHPNRGVIMRYLGIDPTVNVDTRYRGAGGELVEVLEAGPLFLEPGDTLMLCSDGVTDSLDARQVADFMAYPDCQTAADALVSGALKAGAADNVTALVLRLPGGVVAPPAALAPARKKRRWLPIALAALGLLVVLGIAAVLAFSDRGEPQPAAPSAPAVDVAGTPMQAQTTTAPRPGATGGGVQVAAVITPTAAATFAPTLPAIDTTRTISDTAAATGTITGTASISGEPTLIPTFTPIPIRATDTRTLPTAATRTPPGLSASRPDSTGGGVALLRPPEGEKIRGTAEFAWQDKTGFGLKPGEQYELIVWGLDEDPLRDGRSPVGGTILTAKSADLTGLEAALRLSSGQSYYWGVRLLSAAGTPVRMLSEGRKFDYDRPAGGGGGAKPAPPTPAE